MEPAIRVLAYNLAESNFAYRQSAASYLALFGAKALDAAPRITKLLNDAEPKVRLEAVKALAVIQGKDVVLASRFQQMANDPDASVRASVQAYLTRTEQTGD